MTIRRQELQPRGHLKMIAMAKRAQDSSTPNAQRAQSAILPSNSVPSQHSTLLPSPSHSFRSQLILLRVHRILPHNDLRYNKLPTAIVPGFPKWVFTIIVEHTSKKQYVQLCEIMCMCSICVMRVVASRVLLSTGGRRCHPGSGGRASQGR